MMLRQRLMMAATATAAARWCRYGATAAAIIKTMVRRRQNGKTAAKRQIRRQGGDKTANGARQYGKRQDRCRRRRCMYDAANGAM